MTLFLGYCGESLIDISQLGVKTCFVWKKALYKPDSESWRF
jgi:hypothetical protein